MEVIINGEAIEIAALVAAVQERPIPKVRILINGEDFSDTIIRRMGNHG